MRQVGKSTLLREFGNEYHTFDDLDFLIRFENDPRSFLEAARLPLALDEVQKSPPAFDAIKAAVDRQKRPGRFILSGSVRFSARRQIRESLTGRIALMELLPFTLAECHEKKISDFVVHLETLKPEAVVDRLCKRSWATMKALAHYHRTGGLPGICFRRDAAIRADMLETHLETMLSRDIQMIRNIRLGYAKLRLLLEELARAEGSSINMSQLARQVGTSVPSIRAILDALTGLFLIRSYGETFYFSDGGLSHHISPGGSGLNRRDLIRLCYHELFAQVNYTARLRVTMRPYQTRGGIDVPFFLEYKSGAHVAIFIEETDRPSHKAMNSFAWLKRKFPKLIAFMFYLADEYRQTTKGMHCVPLHWLY